MRVSRCPAAVVLPYMAPTNSQEIRHLPWNRTARRAIRVALGALVGSALVACGDPSEEEVFTETQGALAKVLGDPCASYPIENSNEIDVNDQSPECDPGYCVTRGGVPGASEGEGVCSCRCDGPEGTGPFCACGDGFACEHLIDDLGLGDRYLAGSYCMPR